MTARVLTLGLVIAVTSCGGSTEPADELGTVPASVRRVSGHSQWARPRQTVALPLTVEVTDDGGRPVPGATIGWTTTVDARFVSRDTRTDIQGRALARVELGSRLGTYTVTALVANDTALSTRFVLYATVDGQAPVGPPPAATIVVSGDGFSPSHVTVRVLEGVRWVWQDNFEIHNIEFDPANAVSPGVGNTSAKRSGSYTGVMNYVGTVDYWCSIPGHDRHGGAITVTN